MNIIRNGLEALAACGGRESALIWNEAGIFIHAQRSEFFIIECVGIRLGPADIADDIFPAEFFKIGRHVVCGGKKLFFIDGHSVAIPRIPAHRRG